MAIVIDGNNTPTAGGIGYGDGTELAFTTVGTSGQVLLSNGASAPTWGTAGTSTTATNLAGGSNGTIPYQSAAGTTQMLAVGTAGQLLQTNGAGAPTWATVSAGFTLGTAVATTSGTAITFTGIPAGTKQVIVNFVAVSSNSTGNFSIQLGTSGGLAVSGYTSNAVTVSGTGALSAGDTSTTLFVLTGQKPATNTYQGSIFCTLEKSSNNRWVLSGILGGDGGTNVQNISAGYVGLSGALTQLEIKALGDTFDSGEINISYI